MAGRRPTSRSRVNASVRQTNPSASSTSRSVTSASAPASHSNNDCPPKHPPSTAAPESGKGSSTALSMMEKNIQVVVRCRQRSEREIQENSPGIVSSKGAKSKEVMIEVSTPVSSMGVVTLPPLRTYPFDLVFGPEADQAMIYHEVVAPMLEEVVLGYNCTLFAYGQTGTGKTYTMQGDLKPTAMGNPSTNAGMIPRVLFRLFHRLEQSTSDYSVKISYLEIYNEELRDLLASDGSALPGNMQQAGNQSKDSAKTMDSNLKIFDDSGKRGVTIQGLEEIVVKDCQTALALLTRGSLRKQIAATKFNDHSSRSHSIFTVTVHVKEAGLVGEDLLKVGKLNLVDLAGSENIGRSGAENKRAREAGIINQSLLTLGRVITALVDGAPHIPYRESKLTRLLQDSLGGRTKTCIIATISPARSNMEETLSTLDYAIRAKSIRNRPELNQRMTRHSLLKDYVAEIDRLKADLVAAREKNGIFFSEETWNQMNAEQELRVTELEETKKQIQIVEAKMRGVSDEFEQSIGLLKMREGELKVAQKRLNDTEQALGKREGELTAVKKVLQEEVIVRQAYQDTEMELDQIANGLKRTASDSLQDLEALFDKLERKTAVLASHTNKVTSQGKKISSSGRALAQALDTLVGSSTQRLSRLRSDVKDFQTKELNTLATISTRIDDHIAMLQKALEVIRAKDEAESEALEIAHRAMQDTHEAFTVGFNAWCTVLKKTCESLNQEIATTSIETLATAEAALNAIDSLSEATARQTCGYINSECSMIRQAKSLLSETSHAEIARIGKQNRLMEETFEAEKLRGSSMKDELLKFLSSFVDNLISEKENNMREVFQTIQAENEKGVDAMEIFTEHHNHIMEKMEGESAAVAETLHRRTSESKRTRDGALKAISNAKTQLNVKVAQLNSGISESVTSYSAQSHKLVTDMSRSCEDGFEQHAKAKRARTEATISLGSGMDSEYQQIRNDISSVSRTITSMIDRVTTESSGLSHIVGAYHNATLTSLGTLQTASENLSKCTQDDLATGLTPRKRSWDYVDQWNLTKPRETILNSLKEKSGDEGSLRGSHFSSEDTELEKVLDPVDATIGKESENIPYHGQSETAFVCTQASKASGLPRKASSFGVALMDTKNVFSTRAARRGR